MGQAPRAVRVIGPGRAGLSLLAAFDKAGWIALAPRGRGDDLADAAHDASLVLIATPDSSVAGVAAAIEATPTAVVAHVAGSLTLDALAPHPRRASLHPLRSLPSTTSDLTGAWFAVDGDPLAEQAVADIGGRPIRVAGDETSRARYHAAAAMASNHLVALLASVETIAAEADVPVDAFLDLVRGTVDNVELHGTRAALTGPVARGDWATVERHLAALPAGEVEAYRALAARAAHLAGREQDVPWA